MVSLGKTRYSLRYLLSVFIFSPSPWLFSWHLGYGDNLHNCVTLERRRTSGSSWAPKCALSAEVYTFCLCFYLTSVVHWTVVSSSLALYRSHGFSMLGQYFYRSLSYSFSLSAFVLSSFGPWVSPPTTQQVTPPSKPYRKPSGYVGTRITPSNSSFILFLPDPAALHYYTHCWCKPSLQSNRNKIIQL